MIPLSMWASMLVCLVQILLTSLPTVTTLTNVTTTNTLNCTMAGQLALTGLLLKMLTMCFMTNTLESVSTIGHASDSGLTFTRPIQVLLINTTLGLTLTYCVPNLQRLTLVQILVVTGPNLLMNITCISDMVLTVATSTRPQTTTETTTGQQD